PDFGHEAENWLHLNAGRGRVLGPILENELLPRDSMMVVVAGGVVFDAEDWVGDAAPMQALFVRLGETPINAGKCEELPPSLDELLSRLDNPVVRVEIAGRGVMPVWWDNEAYQWDGTRLVAENVPHFNLQTTFLCALPDAP